MRLALRGLALTLIAAGALGGGCGDEFHGGTDDRCADDPVACAGGEAGESAGGTGRGGSTGNAGSSPGGGGSSGSAGEGGDPGGGTSGSGTGGSDAGGGGESGDDGGAGAGEGGSSGAGGRGGAAGSGGETGGAGIGGGGAGAAGAGASGGGAGGGAGAGGASGAGGAGAGQAGLGGAGSGGAGTGGAGTGGAGTGGAGTGGTAGAAGTGGAGGACLFPPTNRSVWPDSPTAFCSTGSLAATCSNALGAAFGQDGNYAGPTDVYVKTNGVVSGSLLDVEWQSAFAGPETFANATDYCENLGLGSRDDWRLPTRLELLSILDYGRFDPALDDSVFDAPTGTYRGFWTRNQHASSGQDHWIVNSEEGVLEARANILPTMVRCVRGTVFATMLTELSGCAIILDSVTGLGWQKWPSGQVFGWTGALGYCEDLAQDGFSDWRLPSVKELETIVNPTALNPAVDANLFPGTPAELFWTSTPYVDNPANAWAVDFWDGSAVHGQATSTAHRVRCVRAGNTALR